MNTITMMFTIDLNKFPVSSIGRKLSFLTAFCGSTVFDLLHACLHLSLCVSWILWINLSWFINRWNSNDLQHNTSLTRNGLMWSINSLFIFCYLPATIPSHNPWSHAFLNSMALHNCKDKNMLWIFRNLACVCMSQKCHALRFFCFLFLSFF